MWVNKIMLLIARRHLTNVRKKNLKKFNQRQKSVLTKRHTSRQTKILLTMLLQLLKKVMYKLKILVTTLTVITVATVALILVQIVNKKLIS